MKNNKDKDMLSKYSPYLKKITLLASVIFTLHACTSVTTAELGSGDEEDARVEYQEHNFSSKLAVVDLKERQVGDLLQVSASLRNKWGMSLSFEYQFRFFDNDGFPISVEGRPWTPIVITGQDEVNVTALAPNPSAAKFKIVIKR